MSEEATGPSSVTFWTGLAVLLAVVAHLVEILWDERKLIRASVKTSFSMAAILVSIFAAILCEILESAFTHLFEDSSASIIPYTLQILNFTSFIAVIGSATMAILRKHNIGQTLARQRAQHAVFFSSILFFLLVLLPWHPGYYSFILAVVQNATYALLCFANVSIWFIAEKGRVQGGVVAQILITVALAVGNTMVLARNDGVSDQATAERREEAYWSIHIAGALVEAASVVREFTLPGLLHMVLHCMERIHHQESSAHDDGHPTDDSEVTVQLSAVATIDESPSNQLNKIE